MRQWLLFIIVGLMVIVAGAQLARLYATRADLENRLKSARSTMDVLIAENEQLESDVEYFGEKENLVKELKSQFNYVEPGEKLLIIVPGTSSTSTQ